VQSAEQLHKVEPCTLLRFATATMRFSWHLVAMGMCSGPTVSTDPALSGWLLLAPKNSCKNVRQYRQCQNLWQQLLVLHANKVLHGNRLIIWGHYLQFQLLRSTIQLKFYNNTAPWSITAMPFNAIRLSQQYSLYLCRNCKYCLITWSYGQANSTREVLQYESSIRLFNRHVRMQAST